MRKSSLWFLKRNTFIYSGLGMVCFVTIVFSPILALGIGVFEEIGKGNSHWLGLILPTGRRWQLLWHSTELAIVVALTGTILGGLIACSLWQRRWTFGLRWGLLPFLFLPPYIHTFAWSATSAAVNNTLQSFGYGGFSLQGWLGCWWVEIMSFLPIAVGLALIGLQSVDLKTIEAARLLRSDLQVLIRVIVPLAAPTLWASGGLLFLLSFTDYSIPSLFGVGSYALEIFAEYGSSNEPVRAFLLALPFLLVAGIVIVAVQSPLRQTMQQSSCTYIWEIGPVWPTWFSSLQVLTISLLLLQMTIPLFSLAGIIGNLENLISPLTGSVSEIIFTFGLAATTAITCLPLAMGVVGELGRSDWRSVLGWWLITAALALPGPLVGVGLIALWNRPLWFEFYGTAIMPLLANLARFTPLAALVLFAQSRQVDPLLWDAASLIPAPRWRLLLYIRLPLLLPGLLAASSLVFALSLGELGATIIVIPPGYSTLTMRIYNYLHYGASANVAVLCLVIAISALFAGGLTALVLAGWSCVQPKGFE